MPTTPENIPLRGLLRVVSQQWAALGVSLHADSPANYVIDPEALLWCTLEVGRHDPRLFDEVIDWLEFNHDKIAVGRLKAIADPPSDARWRILSSVAKRLRSQPGTQSWDRLRQRVPKACEIPREPEPLFHDERGNALLPPTKPDSDFLERGLLRTPFETRKLSESPNLLRASATLLRARALFGTRATAHIWTVLLACHGAFQAELADRTGYILRNLSRPLGELVEAGICREERRQTAKWYALADRPGWRRLLGLEGVELRWPHWIRLFRGLIHLSRAWTACQRASQDGYLLASALREAFVEAKDDIVASGLPVTAPTPDLFLADELIDRLSTYLAELFRLATGTR